MRSNLDLSITILYYIGMTNFADNFLPYCHSCKLALRLNNVGNEGIKAKYI